ncbi:MAG: hypothetical protein J6N20_15200 [Pseudomonas sp.]|nr:hypothetical protein [Pseudomonas sp.]
MTNKPMLSVEREFLERLLRVGLNAVVIGCKTPAEELRAILDKPVAQNQVVPVVCVELVENKIHGGMHIVKWDNLGKLKEGIHKLYAEQPAPVADHTQCEECKGWGYHENHHEGGGTECGECGGSGNATVAVAVVMPDRMKAEPFTTIDRGSKNYKAGYNAALAEVARLNGVKP